MRSEPLSGLVPLRNCSALAIAGFWLALLSFTATASEPRQWERLTHCIYLADQNNDGDSFRVKCAGKEFMLRLYFVDAPETNLSYAERTHEQSEYFGITLDETMKAGVQATEAVRKTLDKTFTVWTRWADAGGRGRENRYYALVEMGEKNLGEILIAKGLARDKGVRPNLPDGEKSKTYREKLYALEDRARQQGLGAWATSSGR